MASSTGMRGEDRGDIGRKREEESTGEILLLSRGMMPRAVGVCVCAGAHAPSYRSYFMAKLFQEKNNSISLRGTSYGTWHPRSRIRVLLASVDSGMLIEERIGFHFWLSTTIIT